MDKLLRLPYFNLVMVMQVRGITEHNARIWLSRQSKAGKLIRLIRGLYMPREYYLRHLDSPDLVGVVAAAIQPHSYLSDAWVLQKHGIMTEGIFNVTCVSTKHTREIVNEIGRFVYYHINPKYFEGYTEEERMGGVVREATVGKALYDYLYLRKIPAGMEEEGYSVVEDLRLNTEHLGPDVRVEFEGWVSKYGSTKMKKLSKNMRRVGWGS